MPSTEQDVSQPTAALPEPPDAFTASIRELISALDRNTQAHIRQAQSHSSVGREVLERAGQDLAQAAAALRDAGLISAANRARQGFLAVQRALLDE